jgi:UDP-glucose 4-epimerase
VEDRPKKVLIVGIAGGHGRLLARRLARTFEVVGVDRQPMSARLPEVRFHQVDILKRGFEDAFRTERPDAVIHLGFVRHFRGSERYDVNVRGTRQLLDHCVSYGVRNVGVLSTSYVYGALPENPSFIDEEHPLSGSRNYPEIRDRVEVDALATGAMWRHPDMSVFVLRPVPTLGYYVDSTMKSYLARSPVPVVMGFNPMMQFIHEEDLTEAIALALEGDLRGVYNVTGPGEVPLRVAIHEAGRRALPLPEPVLRRLTSGLFGLPSGVVDFAKYPFTIAGERFVKETSFRPLFGIRETLRSIR